MAKRVPGSPEWVQDIEIPEYKRQVKKRTRALFGATAEQFGFEFVEEAERRFRGNGQHFFYAQLIEEWATEVTFLVGKHLQFLESVPSDGGDTFFATLPAFDPNRVPAQVTMFQAHIALELESTPNATNDGYDVDKLAQVDAFLNDAANFADFREQKRAQIAWNMSGAIRRDAALVAAIGTHLGYDSAGLDNLFRTAVRIRPEGSGNP